MIRNFLDKQPNLHPTAFVDPSAVVIGDVHLAKDSSLWPTVVARGDIHGIHIGEASNIQDGTVIHVTHESQYSQEGGYPTIIEDHVTVGHQVILHACHVKSYSLIGMGAVLLDGAVVESNVVVAAGSVVPPGKTLTSGYLWLGNPVQQKRPLTQKEMDYFAYSAQYYLDLKNQHLKSLSDK